LIRRLAALAAISALCLVGGSAAVAKSPKPVVTGFSPSSGGYGTAVTILGSNLAGAKVAFNGVVASPPLVSGAGTRIIVKVPVPNDENEPETGPIVVTTPGGAIETKKSFTLVLPNTGSTSTAVALAPSIAKAAFARNYDLVWGYLDPTYQKAVTETHWRTCQVSHPAAPPDITITKVSVADTTDLPVVLPLLGHRTVQEIELQVEFKSSAGTQYAVEYTFWLHEKGIWRAVWLADEYAAYKSGKCYLTPEGPPIY
jgi:hypothetical protein